MSETAVPTPPDTRPTEERPRYVPPQVIVFTAEELLAKLGPARACTSYNPFGTSSIRLEQTPPPESTFDAWSVDLYKRK